MLALTSLVNQQAAERASLMSKLAVIQALPSAQGIRVEIAPEELNPVMRLIVRLHVLYSEYRNDHSLKLSTGVLEANAFR